MRKQSFNMFQSLHEHSGHRTVVICYKMPIILNYLVFS